MVHGDNPPPASWSVPFRLGDWQVLPDQNRIVRGQEKAHLEPRVMELLVHLCRHAGNVVSKHHIIDSVWHQQIVAESALSRCMAVLRRALGDDVGQPSYIETIPKRGYRVIAEVEGIDRIEEAHQGALSTFRVRVGEHEITLAEGQNTVGRDPSCAVYVDSPKVSRRHALIVVEGKSATLEDAGSKNGTYIRGARVTERVVLGNGDEIIVGSTMVKVLVDDDDSGTETISDSGHDDGTREGVKSRRPPA
jgi:DNA-binding winged helix-turn-helix (wHTH) protein